MSPARCYLFFLCLLLAACSEAPVLELPTPSHDRYSAIVPTAVHAMSTREMVVAGHLMCVGGAPEALVLLTSDGGKTWRRHAVEFTPIQGLRLDCISFVDRLRGWVAGIRVNAAGHTQAIVLRTEDGGNHWRESMLPLQTDLVLTGIRAMKRETDNDGTIAVATVDAKSGEARECVFKSGDGGRSWMGVTWMQACNGPAPDFSTFMLGSGQGFHLRSGTAQGTTLLEITGNDGASWMPVTEISLGALPSYY